MMVDAIPDRSFEGKIEAIDARVSAELRNVTARAVFANPDRKLLPGMFANLTVTTGEPASVLTVPRTAIVYSLYGDNVFVVRAIPHGREQGGVSDKGGPSGLIVDRRFRARGSGARRKDCDRERPEGRRESGDRRADQAAGLYAGHDRRDSRASAASPNTAAVTDRR